jgi:hypothetical protein
MKKPSKQNRNKVFFRGTSLANTAVLDKSLGCGNNGNHYGKNYSRILKLITNSLISNYAETQSAFDLPKL